MTENSKTREPVVFGYRQNCETSSPQIHPENLNLVIQDLLQKSSVYAVSQLVSSSGSLRRALWMFVLVVGFLGCLYEVYQFLGLFFSYPVVITLEVENNWKIDFPAVTVCNLNSVSNQFYACLQDKPALECGKELEDNPHFTVMKLLDRHNFSKTSEDVKKVLSDEVWKLSSTLGDKTKEIKRDFGAQYMTRCLFNGELCSIRNFSEFRSNNFGTCLIFNFQVNRSEKPLLTSYIGPNSGLELTLNLAADNSDFFSNSVGTRVVIHDSNREPNPENHGININPGFETSFSIKQFIFNRLPAPYKDGCKNYESNGSYDRSREECVNRCLEMKSSRQSEDLTSSISCETQNRTDGPCHENVTKSFLNNHGFCSCALPCKVKDYEMTISLAEWPAKKYFNKYLKTDYEKERKARKSTIEPFDQPGENATKTAANETDNSGSDEKCYQDCKHKEQDIDRYRKMHSKLKIFYKTLDRTSYTQEPMFQDSELFSQLGGQLGLWLGVSLMALFECAESCYHMMSYFIKRKRSDEKRKRSVMTAAETLKIC